MDHKYIWPTRLIQGSEEEREKNKGRLMHRLKARRALGHGVK